MLKFYSCGIGIVVALSGCSRISTTTTISPDGSFSRTSLYTISKGNMGPRKEATFHGSFTLPEPNMATLSGPKDGKSEKTLNVTTHALVGENSSAGDLVLLSDAGKPLVKSHASVKKLSNGYLEYDEVLSWVGTKKPIDKTSTDQIVSILKQGLPEQDRDSAKIEALALELERAMVHILLGPPYPSALEAMTNPDLAKMRLTDLIADRFEADVKKSFPDLTAQQVKSELVQIEKIDEGNVKEMDIKSSGTNPDDANDLTSLLFVVDYPGRLVSTNGLQSRSGKIYWDLYSMAAMYDQVQLTAVVDPNAK